MSAASPGHKCQLCLPLQVQMLVIIAWLVLLPQRWTLIKPFAVSSCSWFVFPFSFSKSWERTGVGFSTILTSYNNVYMRGETFIKVLPLQQHVCKQKPQHARGCMSRCLTTVPVPRELSAQPCKQKLEERHRKSPCLWGSLGKTGSGEGKSSFLDLESRHKFTVTGQSQPAPQ